MTTSPFGNNERFPPHMNERIGAERLFSGQVHAHENRPVPISDASESFISIDDLDHNPAIMFLGKDDVETHELATWFGEIAIRSRFVQDTASMGHNVFCTEMMESYEPRRDGDALLGYLKVRKDVATIIAGTDSEYMLDDRMGNLNIVRAAAQYTNFIKNIPGKDERDTIYHDIVGQLFNAEMKPEIAATFPVVVDALRGHDTTEIEAAASDVLTEIWLHSIRSSTGLLLIDAELMTRPYTLGEHLQINKRLAVLFFDYEYLVGSAVVSATQSLEKLLELVDKLGKINTEVLNYMKTDNPRIDYRLQYPGYTSEPIHNGDRIRIMKREGRKNLGIVRSIQTNDNMLHAYHHLKKREGSVIAGTNTPETIQGVEQPEPTEGTLSDTDKNTEALRANIDAQKRLLADFNPSGKQLRKQAITGDNLSLHYALRKSSVAYDASVLSTYSGLLDMALQHGESANEELTRILAEDEQLRSVHTQYMNTVPLTMRSRYALIPHMQSDLQWLADNWRTFTDAIGQSQHHASPQSLRTVESLLGIQRPTTESSIGNVVLSVESADDAVVVDPNETPDTDSLPLEDSSDIISDPNNYFFGLTIAEMKEYLRLEAANISESDTVVAANTDTNQIPDESEVVIPPEDQKILDEADQLMVDVLSPDGLSGEELDKRVRKLEKNSKENSRRKGAEVPGDKMIAQRVIDFAHLARGYGVKPQAGYGKILGKESVYYLIHILGEDSDGGTEKITIAESMYKDNATYMVRGDVLGWHGKDEMVQLLQASKNLMQHMIADARKEGHGGLVWLPHITDEHAIRIATSAQALSRIHPPFAIIKGTDFIKNRSV